MTTDNNNLTELRKEREVFNHIADILASSYEVIHYVKLDDDSYASFVSGSVSGRLKLLDEGKGFFDVLRNNTIPTVHPKDRERVSESLSRESILSQLRKRNKFILDYRVPDDGEIRYMRVIAMRSSDREFLLVCSENIDSEIQKEKERLQALNNEKELARSDELTGTKNKTAYLELESSVQSTIDSGADYLTFAIVVCDINGLKQVNDTEGHKAGDEYIRECARLISETYTHSPVFRIGGDEFVVFIRGIDYAFKDALFEKLRRKVLANRNVKGRAVVASGISSYDPLKDKTVKEVFDRADEMMYINKRDLKSPAAAAGNAP